MTINNKNLVNRWNSVMNDIGCEHLTIGTVLSELEASKDYYNVKDGISVSWMTNEAKYWLSCYYEAGNLRCDDKYCNSESYKVWLSETGKLKRLIARLEEAESEMVVTW
jgi:hypothetical protein